jgi:glutamate-1-semialdehyde 2,1-aminomutase
MAGFEKSRAVQARSHQVIPGGAHTYAKGDDQFPEQMPVVIARGCGCMVWDVDGNAYIEYAMGGRAVTLGHAYAPVIEAAYRQMCLGSSFIRPAAIEVACAEALLGLLPGTANMVKFAKNGSDVTTAAVRLARAYTGRGMVAVCGDQPFFSTDDWFIGTTPMNAGVPESDRQQTVTFRYNDLASVQQLFDRYPNRIACVMMEPETVQPPVDSFIHRVRDLCTAHGVVFVLDEMITGFRWAVAGAQNKYDVEPDLATFGKALGNGFAVSALTGRRELMELGGLRHEQERVFLLSTTHGGETHALAAAIEVMRLYQTEDVVGVLYRQGERLRTGIRQAVASLGLEGYFELLGQPCNLVYATRDEQKQPSQPFRTLFLQEMIKRGVLAPSFVVSFSHGDSEIDRTVEAAADSLTVYRKALEDGIEGYLVGRPVKPVFRRYV